MSWDLFSHVWLTLLKLRVVATQLRELIKASPRWNFGTVLIKDF